MKILFGVQGTGNGHLTRSGIIIKLLRSKGHEIDVIISGRKKDKLWGIQDLKPYNVFDGLSYESKKGKIQKLKTIKNAGIFQFLEDLKKIKNDNYDLIISDYEPLSAYLAKKWKKTSIGIAHQYAFEYDIPKTGYNLFTHFLMKKYAPVDINIGLHWHHFNQPILPPIIEKIDLHGINEKSDQIMVYLPWEDIKFVSKLLSKIQNITFLIYCNVEKEMVEKNIKYRPLSRKTFLNDLKESEGIITNAGFETPSEALSMGKKVFVKPLKGQFEQLSNAKALKQLNLATVVNKLTKKNIEKWCLKTERKKIKCEGVADQIIYWLEKGDFDRLNELKSKFWN